MDINSGTKSEDRVLDLKRAILRGDDALGDHLSFESIRHSDEVMELRAQIHKCSCLLAFVCVSVWSRTPALGCGMRTDWGNQ